MHCCCRLSPVQGGEFTACLFWGSILRTTDWITVLHSVLLRVRLQAALFNRNEHLTAQSNSRLPTNSALGLRQVNHMQGVRLHFKSFLILWVCKSTLGPPAVKTTSVSARRVPNKRRKRVLNANAIGGIPRVWNAMQSVAVQNGYTSAACSAYRQWPNQRQGKRSCSHLPPYFFCSRQSSQSTQHNWQKQ